jgi:signal peptidase II
MTTAPARARRWVFLAAVASTLLAADQVSKFYAVRELTTAFDDAHATTLRQQLAAFVREHHLGARALPPVTIVPAFWSHRYAENPGAAWSFAASWPERVRVPFFHLVSLLAIGIIGFYFRSLRPDQRLLRVALALVMGGALGNLADRLARGYVIDFIDWHLNDPGWLQPALHWPTFNVADAGITSGVALIALDSVLGWFEQRRTAAAAGPGASASP